MLDAHGTPKTAWTNLTGAANAGDSTINVDAAAGWRVGDEVVITPTEPTTVGNHWEHHDRRTVTSVSGARIGLDRPLEFPHPAVTVRPGVTHRAEVLNLSRNVVIGGTPEGRSHVIMLSTTAAQQISHIGLHNMGPRQGDNEVLGRYAIHFHADYDGSHGSLVEGVAVYDSTGHGFAAHLSNGVTFRDCIAHDMVDDAFWWDLSLDGGGRDLVPSHNIVYERCVAHFVKSGGNSKFNLTGFLMGAGDGNIARGCVATGVEGGAESSAGFHWPSLSRDDNTWTFEGNVAHNDRHSGIYFWQNGKPRTLVDGFTAYHCGQGIFAGSYANLVSYRDCNDLRLRERRAGHLGAPGEGGRGIPTRRSPTQRMYVDQAGSVRLRRAHHETPRPRWAGHRDLGLDVPGRHGGPDRAARGRRPPAAVRLRRLHVRGQRVLAGRRRVGRDRVARHQRIHRRSPSARPTKPGDPRPEWNAVTTAT